MTKNWREMNEVVYSPKMNNEEVGQVIKLWACMIAGSFIFGGAVLGLMGAFA